MGGGALYAPLPALVFCPLIKISLGNPYLKIIDISKHIVADAPLNKKKSTKFVLPLSQSTFKYGPQNRQ